MKRFRLTLDITFNPYGVSSAELQAALEGIVSHAMDRGLITGETEAEVETHSVEVVELPTEGVPQEL